MINITLVSHIENYFCSPLTLANVPVRANMEQAPAPLLNAPVRKHPQLKATCQ
ncbi:hypothetical protein Nos7524_3088 [Nostoc sp. PCC 7524]|uniref:hypothetical protein n=1 Tax=Nostoc sp. (strain ATCC 29411 / PCC 7524) TaxID=28072 RepID=UPI00029F29ED|nr:hypothetical protein [Nostoc sp. PCC 7524]AFY48891.1 hypothetical protein Nos7524_3088 [Nostoc sp. PCC 7524]